MGSALAGLLVLSVFLAASLIAWRVTLSANESIHSASALAIGFEMERARTMAAITTTKGDNNNNTLLVNVDNAGSTSVPVTDLDDMDVLVFYDSIAQPSVRLTYTAANPPLAGEWTKTAISGSFEPQVWNPAESMTILATLVGATCAPGTVTVGFPNGIVDTSPFTCSGLALTFHSETADINGTTYYQLKNGTPADGSASTVSVVFAAETVGRQAPPSNAGKFVFPLTGITSLPAGNWDLTYRTKRDPVDNGWVWFTNATDISPIAAAGSHQSVNVTGSHELETVAGTHDGLITGTSSAGNNKPNLTDFTATFVADGVTAGIPIQNVTDGSSSTTGTVTATEIDTVLAGGVEDDWDTGDVYTITILNSAHLIDSTADFPTAAVITGYTVQNTTDGSSATITAVRTVVVEGSLSGGTDDDWDVGDAYIISFTNRVCLYDSAANFTASGVTAGDLILNTTDGSSATVTSVTATLVCGTLAGGTDDDWDSGDNYVIRLQNVAVLRDTTADFVTSGVAVGDYIENTTDGSTSVVTAVTTTTVTGILAGGTDDDWDDTDVYKIVPLDRWVDISLAAAVPVGATGVTVEVINSDTGIDRNGLVRAKEDTRDYMSNAAFQEIYRSSHRWQIVKLDSNRVIQAHISNQAVNFKMLGYTIGTDPVYIIESGVTPDVTPAANGLWSTVDISNYVDDDANGAILFVDSQDSVEKKYLIREQGGEETTQDNINEYGNTVFFVGLNPDKHFEAQLDDVDVRIYLVAQTKGSVGYYVTDIPVTDPVLDSWQELDADDYGIPTRANGLIFHFDGQNDLSDALGFRHGDSTDDWDKDVNDDVHLQSAIGLRNSDNVWDMYMEDDKADVYIAGYTRLTKLDVVANVDVIIRKADDTIRSTLLTNVADTASLNSDSWETSTITFAFPGYTVVDDTDYLEIDLYAEATTNLSGESVSVDFRIDDPTLAISNQMRVAEVTP